MADNAAILARHLALAFLAGLLKPPLMADRAARVIDARPKWLPALARRIVAKLGETSAPSVRQIIAVLLADGGFRRRLRSGELRFTQPILVEPAPAPGPWTVPLFNTVGALAARLELPLGQFDWFADPKELERRCKPGPLRHYRYHWVAKRSGGARLVEAPKPRLKRIQRRILHGILDHVPPHEAAHGFRAGRSIATFAEAHVGKRVVLRVDLQDFFPSIPRRRTTGIFLTAGYALPVALALANLCTNSAPTEVWREAPAGAWDDAGDRSRRLYQQAHLPQGAPTSPALANLAAFGLDVRLAALAAAAGAAYTRYADDLVFSGGDDLRCSARRFLGVVAVVAEEEGFAVHHRKCRILPASVCQKAAGVVVNSRLNVRRCDYDLLKAILNNTVRFGTASQNRAGIADFRSHLLGRIAHVAMLNPTRAAKLRTIFEKINWAAPAD